MGLRHLEQNKLLRFRTRFRLKQLTRYGQPACAADEARVTLARTYCEDYATGQWGMAGSGSFWHVHFELEADIAMYRIVAGAVQGPTKLPPGVVRPPRSMSAALKRRLLAAEQAAEISERLGPFVSAKCV